MSIIISSAVFLRSIALVNFKGAFWIAQTRLNNSVFLYKHCDIRPPVIPITSKTTRQAVTKYSKAQLTFSLCSTTFNIDIR